MTIFASFLLILAFVTVAISIDLSLKDDPCAKFDTCYAKPPLRTCTCDDDCRTFGTCCKDAIKGRFSHASNEYLCYHQHTVTPVFVKRSCADDFRGQPGVVQDCFDDDLDDTDIQNNRPVTSRKTKTSYWSSKCAICSQEIEDDLELWSIEVFCPAKPEVNRGLIRRNLTFDDDTKQWGLTVGGEFLQCVVKYAPPPFIDEVRHCTPDLIASCPANYSNENIAKKCLTYYGERKLKNADLYYKNIHCAVCNGADVAELECPGITKPEDAADDADFREMVEEVFTNGQWLEKEAGKRFKCGKGFMYSPFWKRCRRQPEEMRPMAVIDRNFSTALRKDYSMLWIVLLIFLF